MGFKRNGFTMANGFDALDDGVPSLSAFQGVDEPPTDAERLVDVINRLLKSCGKSEQLSPSLEKPSDVVIALEEIVTAIEANALAAKGKTAMANRQRPSGTAGNKPLSDIAMAERIAKRTGKNIGEVLKTMPKFGI